MMQDDLTVVAMVLGYQDALVESRHLSRKYRKETVVRRSAYRDGYWEILGPPEVAKEVRDDEKWDLMLDSYYASQQAEIDDENEWYEKEAEQRRNYDTGYVSPIDGIDDDTSFDKEVDEREKWLTRLFWGD